MSAADDSAAGPASAPDDEAASPASAPDDEAVAGLPPTLLFGLLAAAAIAPLGSSTIAVALPAIGGDLETDNALLTQLLVASYLIVSVACQGPGGKLGDLLGHRHNLRVGLGVYAVGALCGLLAPGLWLLTLCRLLMAAGAALAVPSVVAQLRNHTAADRRARAFAAFGVVMGVAAASGPLLGGELTRLFGWRSIFAAPLLHVTLAALLVEASSRGLDPHVRTTPLPRFDILGLALLSIAATLLVIGLRPGGTPALWALGFAALAAFVTWELRVEAPAVDLRVFRRRTYALCSSIHGLNNLAMYPLLFQLPIFFGSAGTGDAAASGRALVWMMGGMVIAAPLGARVSERMGVRATLTLAQLVAIGGMLLLSRVHETSAPAAAIPALSLVGIGLGLGNPAMQAAGMGAVEPHEAGMAAGVMSTLRYLGGLVGIAVLGALLSRGEGMPLLEQHAAPVTMYLGALCASLLLVQLLPWRVPAATPG